jgi:hypothetical protein
VYILYQIRRIVIVFVIIVIIITITIFNFFK